ncbi:hypothetical protein KTS45_10355 [Halomicroarcula limicola]|uniref:Uncharacterized protein n=1 Tax=Haloarcula limicola TaxID=1429915 RepID=A0A8J8C4W0_9EURY|nr:hypothetical protein [Halomicroarcula limicola]MBV0924599.1 hypothetical protein [Halomicroarcula limicola]
MVADDRGQLLLFGGITVAVVFLVTIALTNSLIVTQNVATPDNADRIERVADREAAVERDLQTIVARTRATNDTDEFADALNRSLANYSTYQTRVSGARTGAYVGVTLNKSSSRGYRTTGSGDFQRPDPSGPGSANDWPVVEDAGTVSTFDMTVTTVNGGPSNAYTVVVEGDSGDRWRLRVLDPLGPVERAVRVEHSGTTSTVCSTPTDTQDIRLNVTTGKCTIAGAPTTFQPFEAVLDSPYDVRFENGNRAGGNYVFASTGTYPSESYSASDYTSYPAVPAIDVTYTNYERTILVNETP